MPIRPMHACACPGCIRPEDHGDRAIHLQMNLFFSRLDEQQRRWYAALESRHVGHGGDRLVSQITGISEKCIRRGHAELDAGLTGRPHDRIRRPGGGRRKLEEKDPELESTLITLVEGDTACDPMSHKKWPRKTLRKLEAELAERGHPASFMTVRRLLKGSGYSLRVNARRKEAKVNHPDREQQFRHIAEQKQDFLAHGDPVVSVDTQKKSL